MADVHRLLDRELMNESRAAMPTSAKSTKQNATFYAWPALVPATISSSHPPPPRQPTLSANPITSAIEDTTIE